MKETITGIPDQNIRAWEYITNFLQKVLTSDTDEIYITTTSKYQKRTGHMFIKTPDKKHIIFEIKDDGKRWCIIVNKVVVLAADVNVKEYYLVEMALSRYLEQKGWDRRYDIPAFYKQDEKLKEKAQQTERALAYMRSLYKVNTK